MLYVFDTCASFIRTVPIQVGSERDPNDIEKGPEDHVADETRYACMSRPYFHAKPKSRRGIADPLTYNDLHEQLKRSRVPQRKRI